MGGKYLSHGPHFRRFIRLSVAIEQQAGHCVYFHLVIYERRARNCRFAIHNFRSKPCPLTDEIDDRPRGVRRVSLNCFSIKWYTTGEIAWLRSPPPFSPFSTRFHLPKLSFLRSMKINIEVERGILLVVDKIKIWRNCSNRKRYNRRKSYRKIYDTIPRNFSFLPIINTITSIR